MTSESPAVAGSTDRPRGQRALLLSPALALVGAVSWWLGLAPVQVDRLGGLGLVTQLRWPTLLAYPLLLAAVVVELAVSQRRGGVLRAWWLTILTGLLVVAVYGLQPAVEGVARMPVAWLHVGFAELIERTGGVLPSYDARMSWPGFFSAAAMWGAAADVHDVRLLLNWAPLVFAGVTTVAVRALAASVLRSDRAAWIATWTFVVTNWTEQDYFSPQAMSYVLMVAALALVGRFLLWPALDAKGGDVRAWRRRLPPGTRPPERLLAQISVLALAVALAPSHQLTPYVLATMLLVLLLWGRLSSGWLPVLVGLPAITWFVLAAKDFWLGQLQLITGSVGDVNASLTQGVAGRLVGDVGHVTVVGLRIAIFGLVVLAAGAGLLVLRRRGVRSWVIPAVAASAFGLAVVQPYGGEIFLRCYLYALPFFCLGAGVGGDALLNRARGRAAGWRHVVPAVGLGLALSVLALGTVVARGGNDAYTAMTHGDVAAIDYVYRVAPRDSTLAALRDAAPLRLSRVDTLTQLVAADLGTAEKPCTTAAELTTCVVDAGADYVFINPQQDEQGVILDGLPSGWTHQVQEALVVDQNYRVVYDQDDRVVLAGPGVSDG
ncbi:MAG: hypothetical protein ACR2LI_13235 [Propionibacteriaceae bacterium]